MFLTGLGSFQFVFLYRFLQTLFRTLIHEEIIPQKKSNAAALRQKESLPNKLIVGNNGGVRVEVILKFSHRGNQHECPKISLSISIGARTSLSASVRSTLSPFPPRSANIEWAKVPARGFI